MKGWFTHNGGTDPVPPDDMLPHARPLAATDRACCCPAKPAVTVVMPSVPDRPHPTDLLLCGHHYRASRAALGAVGATIYSESGTLIAAGAGGQMPACREPLPA